MKLRYLILALALGGCGLIPTTASHPAWAANSGWCAVAANSIAQALTSSVPIAGAAVAGAAAVCEAESSIIAGPPAVQTASTTTTTTMVSHSP